MTARAQRFLQVLERWASAGWSGSVVFGWGLAQGTVVPGLADVVWLPLALAKPDRAYRLGLIAALGTCVGCLLLYFLSAGALSEMSEGMLNWVGVDDAGLERVKVLIEKYGWMAIVVSHLTPLSSKLTSVASGMFGVPWPEFAAALVLGRLLRVMAIAWLVQRGGRQLVAQWTKSGPHVL